MLCQDLNRAIFILKCEVAPDDLAPLPVRSRPRTWQENLQEDASQDRTPQSPDGGWQQLLPSHEMAGWEDPEDRVSCSPRRQIPPKVTFNMGGA